VARHETRTWYRIAFADGDKQVLVAAAGEHIGVAIAAAGKQVKGHPIAVDNAAEADIPLGESVNKDHIVQLGDAHESAFHWPTGVLPTLGKTEAIAGARRGFAIVPQKDLFVVEAQVEGPDVQDAFMSLVERLPAADNLEVKVLDHFEGADKAPTEVWVTSRLNGHKIIRLLDDHDVDLFGNGHLELNVYAREAKGTLRLTEHKTIVWLANDGSLEGYVTRWMSELKIPRVESLVRVHATSHFHYRPAASRARKRLTEELYRQRLRKAAVLTRG